MADFSIELAAKRITDARTKSYFGEVQSCYANGNYRSAIVMLWSVVVADLLFKLDTLQSLYGDATASSILSQIATIQAKNPKSPDWESKLVEEVAARTHLFDVGEAKLLVDLQELRHLCAHPVLKQQVEALFTPSHELARAHIRNALEAVLGKPPMMSAKVFDSLLNDLEEKAPLLPDDPSLKRFLESKYLSGMTAATMSLVFRSLWRVCFKVTADARAEANRPINYRTLKILAERLGDKALATIEGDRAYFSELAVSGSPPTYLFPFLGTFPTLYDALTDAAKTLISGLAGGSIELFVSGWFLSLSVPDHMATLFRRASSTPSEITPRLFVYLKSTCEAHNLVPLIVEFAVDAYTASPTFDEADLRFSRFIEPLLEVMTADQLEQLLANACTNSQAYGRKRAAWDHHLVLGRLKSISGVIADKSKYPALFAP